MNNKIEISASLLSANFLHLESEMKKCENAGVNSFHLDVIDGHLAPNITYGPPIIKYIRQATNLFLDAHLMIDNPWIYLDDFINCKVDSILLHAESYGTEAFNTSQIKIKPRTTNNIDIQVLKRDLDYIHHHNIQTGLTLNPGTPVEIILPILPKLDRLLFMSVNPGFSGQTFIPEVLAKIKIIRPQFNQKILIDGGINNATAPLALSAGVDVLVTASYLFGSNDYKEAVQALLPNT